MKGYDLVVIGAGSGNMLLGPELAGLRTAIVEPDRFGGTCLNRGCIPSKMLVVAADAARAVTDAGRLGVRASLEGVDWAAVRDRVFGRLDPLHDQAVAHRRRGGIDVYQDAARFVGPGVLEVGGAKITADRIVVAAGSRPLVPSIPGLDTVAFHTSDTIMRLDELPASLIVIGGGFIAAELGHVFSAFGVDVTVVQQGPRMLMAEDAQISARFTELAARHVTLRVDTAVTAVASRGNGVAVTVERAGEVEVLASAALLVATGRRPNTDLLDVAAAGLEVDEHGHLITDDSYVTSAPGVWAFGDAANHFQLKHMANAEGRVVAHNIAHPDAPRRLRRDVVPRAVFADPQVAAVGLTEESARDRGIEYVVAVRDYADTAYGWALEDTTSFVKLLADPRARTVLGAHIIGPQASTLIQPLIQAMMLGQTVDQLAHDVLYIHPAITEVLEQALLAL
ncbi:mycothione reductase [Actinomycetospora sp. NBRC 106375]|uniref:mycothione reductase n=1 Tax=Actinomycetospora sp. NBRC 106375 TaxID=3032207 RepID=UPI0024A58EEE|nr:mycothione reductase [Actinomycetospora sp. NBRC 106375]GLZ48981.1 mycothione reductase [Actinomycetospora sp. NBRC 106375]